MIIYVCDLNVVVAVAVLLPKADVQDYKRHWLGRRVICSVVASVKVIRHHHVDGVAEFDSVLVFHCIGFKKAPEGASVSLSDLESRKLAEIFVLVVSDNLARFWSGYDVATVCGKDGNQFDDVIVVVASVDYEVDNFTESLACYVYESTVELLSVHDLLFFRLFDVSNVHRFVHLSKRLHKKSPILTFHGNKKAVPPAQYRLSNEKRKP